MKEIEKIIRDMIPEDIRITKIEALGPGVAIFVENIKRVYEYNDLVPRLAQALKRRVYIRTDPRFTLDKEKARKKIEEIAGKDAHIVDVYFDDVFSEVYIEAGKPGKVIGKNGEGLREIMVETGWSPIVVRHPTIPSSIYEASLKSKIAYAEERKKFLQRVAKSVWRAKAEVTWIRAGMLGGFREVGRSCLLVQTKNSKILVDVGIHPSPPSPEEEYPAFSIFNIPPAELDAVIITHAHMDHVGFLPYLFKAGYEGPVYMTKPTEELSVLIQQDYVNLMYKMGREPIYSKKDIQQEIRHIITLSYGEVMNITPDIKLTFYNAGHILGSSIVHLNIGEGKHNIAYTGDLKFGFTMLLNPAEVNLPKAETVFIESTYGTDIAPSRKEAEQKLIKIIKETTKNGGHVLIPAFAIGRSQEIMLVLENYARNDPDWNIPVWIDGMIREASAIHTAYPEYLKASLRKRILSDDSPFKWNMLKLATGKDKKDIIDGEPAVIIAPSGMLTGGPSLEYFKYLAEDERNAIIFVGYQSPFSLGARVQQGVKEVPIPEEGKLKSLKVNLHVESIEAFSGHSDKRQLLAWLANLPHRPKKVFTMHGDHSKTEAFANLVKRKLGLDAEAPMNLEIRRLR